MNTSPQLDSLKREIEKGKSDLAKNEQDKTKLKSDA
jgi:hypothetical protein